jgi:hypothetical protein
MVSKTGRPWVCGRTGWLVALLLLSRSATADDAETRAHALFLEGVAAGQHSEYEHARAAFEESFRLFPRGSTLGNLGLFEVKTGRVLEGIKHLKEALGYPDVDARRRATMEDNLRDADAMVGRLAIDADATAQLTLDGADLGTAASLKDPVEVMPGHHVVEASVGQRSARKDVDANAGTTVQVDIRVEASAEKHGLEPPTARSTPESMPPPRAALAAPPGGESWWTPSHTVAVALSAATVAGLGLGIYFEAANQAAGQDVSRLRAAMGGLCTPQGAGPQCGQLRDKIDSGRQDATAGEVAYAITGAAAIGAAIAWFVSEQSHPTSRGMALAPSIGLGNIEIRGQF